MAEKDADDRPLRIGTRSSKLAIAQVELFKELLPRGITTETIALSTSLGDTNKTTDLHTLASAGKSLWTEDLETELLNRRVDILVHSLKDVPTKLPMGCLVRAVGRREEPRDCILLAPRHRSDQKLKDLNRFMSGHDFTVLDLLPRHAIIGTSSIRRAAMLRRRYPDIQIRDIRGNVPTRVHKLDDESPQSPGYDALVLAGAGVQRLGMQNRIDGWLGRDQGFLHAVGQGAIGVEWRQGNTRVESLLAQIERSEAIINRRRVRWEGVAERAFLRVLEGGCSVPVGVYCKWTHESHESDSKMPRDQTTEDSTTTSDLLDSPEHITMHAIVVSVDGKQCVEGQQTLLVDSDESAETCGRQVAAELTEKGAGKILAEIEINRQKLQGQDNA